MLVNTLNHARIIVCAVALLVGAATSVMAQPTWQEQCRVVAVLAMNIMQARQGGVPMQKLMEMAKDEDEPLAVNIMHTMIEKAYQQPRFHTPDYMQRSISEFTDAQYLSCVKAVRK